MKVPELRKALAEHGVDWRTISIDGVDGADEADEQYRLERSGAGCWITYYCERGNRVGLREFPNDDQEACDTFSKFY